MQDRELQRSPEERTAAFFAQDYRDLDRHMVNIQIVDSGTGRRILVVKTQPWSRAENQKKSMYRKMLDMQPGQLYACHWALRKTNLPLVVAKDENQVGACITITKACRYDSEKKEFVPFKKQGDIAAYLGLGDDDVGQLIFKDETSTLYLVKKDKETESPNVDLGKADEWFEDLLNK